MTLHVNNCEVHALLARPPRGAVSSFLPLTTGVLKLLVILVRLRAKGNSDLF